MRKKKRLFLDSLFLYHWKLLGISCDTKTIMRICLSGSFVKRLCLLYVRRYVIETEGFA